MLRQLHLNLLIHSRGHHEASWRHPQSSPLALTDIRYYQDLAQRAEAARFDSVFVADQLALAEEHLARTGELTRRDRGLHQPGRADCNRVR
jgi:alkanesulfonate monooxygenase SsuD/methylene tetrahydromethanopterin reductase-like flavin-dependent oxidoreductase (luciferase family)